MHRTDRAGFALIMGGVLALILPLQSTERAGSVRSRVVTLVISTGSDLELQSAAVDRQTEPAARLSPRHGHPPSRRVLTCAALTHIGPLAIGTQCAKPADAADLPGRPLALLSVTD